MSSATSSSTAAVAVGFTGFVANGNSGTMTTTELTLHFDRDPVGLALSDLGLTGATMLELQGAGTTRTLMITNITVSNAGTVTLTLTSPAGYTITPASRSVQVYLDLSLPAEYCKLVSVAGGTFMQKEYGSSWQGFSHTITGFKIGKYELIYQVWYAVYQWALAQGYSFANPGREGNKGTDGAVPTSAGKYQPVTAISWRDAIVWCNAYSEMSGKTPVYYSDNGYTRPIKDSNNALQCDDPLCQVGCNGVSSADGG